MKKSHLHNIKETGFQSPESYFDTFDERLFKKIEAQEDMASVSDSGYKTPDNYFDTFDDKLQARLKNEESSKTIKLLTWRNAVYISGIAACIVLMLTVFLKSDDNVNINQVETASIEDYLNDEDMNIYDIASLLNENDLSLDDFVANTITDESLESYLLNNASIEDLINENE